MVYIILCFFPGRWSIPESYNAFTNKSPKSRGAYPRLPHSLPPACKSKPVHLRQLFLTFIYQVYSSIVILPKTNCLCGRGFLSLPCESSCLIFINKAISKEITTQLFTRNNLAGISSVLAVKESHWEVIVIEKEC